VPGVSRRREWLLIAAVAMVAGAAGFGYNAWRSVPEAGTSEAAAAAMSGVRLPDLDGKPQALDQWRGKVVVVNFWATWCAPCREEIPLFVRLQQKYGAQGLQFVGIAIDQPEKVRPYAAELGMNFPILMGGVEGLNLARALGNTAGVLPFTVIVGRDGKIVSTEVGAAKEVKFEAALLPLLTRSSHNGH
jgi:thiol-disulfide isomerase/thioredoxin